jgi:hypothetical protein
MLINSIGLSLERSCRICSHLVDAWQQCWGVRLERIRVTTLVFDYPRHSGATDEGMTQRVLIFGLYGLGLEASPSKGWLKPIEALYWRSPWSRRLVCTARTQRRRPSRIPVNLGFHLLSICNRPIQESWDLVFQYKRLGGTSGLALYTLFHRHLSAHNLESSSFWARSNLRRHCNTSM